MCIVRETGSEKSEQWVRLLEGILASSPDPIFVADRAGACVYASQAGLTALHRSASEVLGLGWREVGLASDFREELDRGIERVLASGRSSSEDVTFSTVDGSRLYDCHLSPISVAGELVDHVVLRIRDVTDRRTIAEDQAELGREQVALAAAETLNRQIQAIQAVTEVGLAHVAHEDLLRELLGRIRRLLGGDTASMLLIEPEHDRLVVQAADGLEESSPAERPIRVGEGIAGRIAQTHEPMIVDDLSTSPVEAASQFLRENIRSLVGAPLLVDGRVIGVVQVGTVRRRVFREDDLRLLRLVADRAALAIDRARLYQQAQLNQARWRTTVESMLDLVTMADATGRATYMNPAYSRFIELEINARLSLEEHPKYYQLYHPDGTIYSALDLPLQRAAIRAEEVRDEVLMQRTSRGQERITMWNAAPLRDADGHVLGAVAVGRDITEARRIAAEEERLLGEVQRQAAELDATITSVADGLVVYDRTGDIIRINPTAIALLGFSAEQSQLHLPDRLKILRPEAVEGRLLSVEELPVSRALRGETIFGQLLVLSRLESEAGAPAPGSTAGSGRRRLWITSSAAPIIGRLGEPLGAVVTFTDITALHDLQEAREDMLRAVSHDLRSPLTVIQGQAQLLQRSLTRSAERAASLLATGEAESAREQDEADRRVGQLRSVESIVAGARQMNGMIQDLVDAARVESGQLALRRLPVDTRRQVLSLIERLLDASDARRIRFAADDDLPLVDADPDRFDRILTNLLTNALKYSTPGTPIGVALRAGPGEVTVSVRDTGPGIAIEDRERVFERYYRARSAGYGREGLGLGLYITKGMIQAHGGRVWIESEPGQGATFHFTIPTISTPAASSG